MLRYLYIGILFLSVLQFTACKDNNNIYDIPNVAVNQYIYLSNPSSFDLKVQGGSIYNPGGYKGLVIFRRYYNLDENDFVAYERACPTHYGKDCGSLLVEDHTYLTCECNDEKFLLFDGTPVDHPSQNVKFYKTVFDGFNVIHVSN